MAPAESAEPLGCLRHEDHTEKDQYPIMTNALVLIEACSICGLVQRVYLGRRGGRKTPLVCTACARPWIQWSCGECGTTNYEQVEALPRRGAHFSACAACRTEADRVQWSRSSREEAQRIRRAKGSAQAVQGRRG